MTLLKPIAITPGCPAGIGPDIVLMLAQQGLLSHVTILADPALLEARAKQLNFAIDWNALENVRIEPVVLSSQSAYVLECLARAVDGCLAGRFHAMVTGPVNKAVINRAGTPFQGHTEWIAERCGTERVIMMLATKICKVALLTTHIPLKDVPSQVTADNLSACISLLASELQQKFAIHNPRITVTGLNPHAGEDGYIGREEIDIMIPAMQQLRLQGLQLTGPVSADTLFQADQLSETDCILAMYHDQGLTPLKTIGFGETVNVTLGLPIIRTSVDHGTAYALAGTGQAHPGSLLAALQMARTLQS